MYKLTFFVSWNFRTFARYLGTQFVSYEIIVWCWLYKIQQLSSVMLDWAIDINFVGRCWKIGGILSIIVVIIAILSHILLSKTISALIMKKFWPPGSFVRAPAVADQWAAQLQKESLWGRNRCCDGESWLSEHLVVFFSPTRVPETLPRGRISWSGLRDHHTPHPVIFGCSVSRTSSSNFGDFRSALFSSPSCSFLLHFCLPVLQFLFLLFFFLSSFSCHHLNLNFHPSSALFSLYDAS